MSVNLNEKYKRNGLEQYEIVAVNFMKKVMGLNYHEMIVTEESWLSDYIGAGLTDKDLNQITEEYDTIIKNGMNYNQTETLYNRLKRAYWDDLVCDRIKKEYKLDIKATNIVLAVLFQVIQKKYDLEKMHQENNSFVWKKEEPKLDLAKLKNKLSSISGSNLSPEEIEKELQTTLNPFLYAKYKGVTFSEAIEIIEERKANREGVFKVNKLSEEEINK